MKKKNFQKFKKKWLVAFHLLFEITKKN